MYIYIYIIRGAPCPTCFHMWCTQQTYDFQVISFGFAQFFYFGPHGWFSLAFKNKYIAHAPKMIYTHARCSHNVHMLPARQDSMIQAAIEKLPKASGEEAGEAGEDEAMDLLEGEEEENEVDDVEEG